MVKNFFKSIYDNLRQEATEVIVFMLSDKDRFYDPQKVNTAPVVYALKGPSMANSDLKKLVNTPRNALKKRDKYLSLLKFTMVNGKTL